VILLGAIVANLHDIIAQIKVNNIKDDKENNIKTRYCACGDHRDTSVISKYDPFTNNVETYDSLAIQSSYIMQLIINRYFPKLNTVRQ
jgi:hypothetical protein